MKKILGTILLSSILSFNLSCQSQETGSESKKLITQKANKIDHDLPLEKINLPEGFKIEVYAKDVKNARSMVFGKNGTLFVGTRNEGNVYAIKDTNKDNYADEIIKVATGLNMPNGVAIKDGDLYVAEVNRVLKYENIEGNLEKIPEPKIIKDDFPTDRSHGWKYIAFGPDEKLYIPVGAPCNICESEDERYASITRMDSNGENFEVFASGIRNTVGFAWNPDTDELWFTDNGRDRLGDNKPTDELNHAPNKGLHFGYPYCHQGDLPDPEYGESRKCSEFISPAIKLGPHVAALGMKFYTKDMFPEKYKKQIFLAEHGSWNRSEPIGYQVSLVALENNKAVKYEAFADGWLEKNGSSWGRPVDILIMPDGSMLVSDDKANAIYRISYEEK